MIYVEERISIRIVLPNFNVVDVFTGSIRNVWSICGMNTIFLKVRWRLSLLLVDGKFRCWPFIDVLGSDNDSPKIFKNDQLYIVLELSHGGEDLESFVFNNAQQALSVFTQVIVFVTCLLSVGEVFFYSFSRNACIRRYAPKAVYHFEWGTRRVNF